MIELLLVIAIIGTLSMVAIPRINRYFDSFEIREARYNHQTIVYAIREWSLQNDDHRIVPNSFTVLNSQGRSVADYLREYNREYFDNHVRNLLPGGPNPAPVPVPRIVQQNPERIYEFQNGSLITTINSRDNQVTRFEFDPLSRVGDRTRWFRG